MDAPVVLVNGEVYGVMWRPRVPNAVLQLPTSPAPGRPDCRVYQARPRAPARPCMCAVLLPAGDGASKAVSHVSAGSFCPVRRGVAARACQRRLAQPPNLRCRNPLPQRKAVPGDFMSRVAFKSGVPLSRLVSDNLQKLPSPDAPLGGVALLICGVEDPVEAQRRALLALKAAADKGGRSLPWGPGLGSHCDWWVCLGVRHGRTRCGRAGADYLGSCRQTAGPAPPRP